MTPRVKPRASFSENRAPISSEPARSCHVVGCRFRPYLQRTRHQSMREPSVRESYTPRLTSISLISRPVLLAGGGAHSPPGGTLWLWGPVAPRGGFFGLPRALPAAVG